MLWTHPARAQSCSVDTDCTGDGTTCGTETCSPGVGCGPASNGYSSCVVDSDCKCQTTCVGAVPASGLEAATPGHCKVVTNGTSSSPPVSGHGHGSCAFAGQPGGAGWEGAAALGALGLVLLRFRRASAR